MANSSCFVWGWPCPLRKGVLSMSACPGHAKRQRRSLRKSAAPVPLFVWECHCSPMTGVAVTRAECTLGSLTVRGPGLYSVWWSHVSGNSHELFSKWLFGVFLRSDLAPTFLCWWSHVGLRSAKMAWQVGKQMGHEAWL